MDDDGKPDRTKDWREVCREAATELDPVKLMHLIAQLTKALNERDKTGPRTIEQDNPNDGAISLDREFAA